MDNSERQLMRRRIQSVYNGPLGTVFTDTRVQTNLKNGRQIFRAAYIVPLPDGSKLEGKTVCDHMTLDDAEDEAYTLALAAIERLNNSTDTLLGPSSGSDNFGLPR